MLDSMMRNPRPTRAEVSDVTNAILDGTDAIIMLSGESANGSRPVEAVETMVKIATKSEEMLSYELASSKAKKHIPPVPGVISRVACNAAHELKSVAIVSLTQSGATAKRISQCAPDAPIVTVTPNERVAKKVALCFGVYPVVAENATMENAVEIAKNAGFVKANDTAVVVAGVPD